MLQTSRKEKNVFMHARAAAEKPVFLTGQLYERRINKEGILAGFLQLFFNAAVAGNKKAAGFQKVTPGVTLFNVNFFQTFGIFLNYKIC